MKRGLGGKTSVRRNRPVSAQNKHEAPIARLLDAKLTAGSGATFANGDMYMGRYLIEHKYRGEESFSLPYSTYEIIRRKAEKRNLTPMLILTNKNNINHVVLEAADAALAYGMIISTHLYPKPRTTITMDPALYEAAVERLSPMPGHIVQGDLCTVGPGRKQLYVSRLEDFRRYMKTGGDRRV